MLCRANLLTVIADRFWFVAIVAALAFAAGNLWTLARITEATIPIEIRLELPALELGPSIEELPPIRPRREDRAHRLAPLTREC